MNSIQNTKLLVLVNVILSCFFLFPLSVKGGYNYAPVLLMLIGLGYWGYAYWSKKHIWQVSPDEKRLILSYLFYFAVFLLSLIAHDEKMRTLDNPSRILFMLPLLFLFAQHSIRFKVVSACIPLGAFIAGIVALYDRFYLHSPMAYSPRIMHIQGGNIAMSFGMFSLVISLYYMLKKQPKLTALCFIAALFGILGSFLSTARGGWIGMPFIFTYILWVYRKSLSKTFLISICGIVSVAIIVAFAIPSTRVIERINMAENEIRAYIEKNNGSTSVGARFDMWKSALLMAKEKPLLGWGIEGVSQERKNQAKQKIISQYASQFSHAHNQFFDDLSKRGILGLLSLLGVLFIPITFFFKHAKSKIAEVKTVAVLGVVHVMSVIFYCVSQGFFIHNSGSIFYFFLVVVFYGMINALNRNQHPTQIVK